MFSTNQIVLTLEDNNNQSTSINSEYYDDEDINNLIIKIDYLKIISLNK
jgi:hypothetical protein